MKVRTAISDAKILFVFEINVWEAAKWHLTGTSLTDELDARACKAAGINPTDPTIVIKQQVTNTPGWLFRVTIQRTVWKEFKEFP